MTNDWKVLIIILVAGGMSACASSAKIVQEATIGGSGASSSAGDEGEYRSSQEPDEVLNEVEDADDSGDFDGADSFAENESPDVFEDGSDDTLFLDDAALTNFEFLVARPGYYERAEIEYEVFKYSEIGEGEGEDENGDQIEQDPEDVIVDMSRPHVKSAALVVASANKRVELDALDLRMIENSITACRTKVSIPVISAMWPHAVVEVTMSDGRQFAFQYVGTFLQLDTRQPYRLPFRVDGNNQIEESAVGKTYNCYPEDDSLIVRMHERYLGETSEKEYSSPRKPRM